VSKLKEMQTPVFWAEGHPGPLTAEGWQVRLDGLVEKPVTLTYEEILALPKSTADARLTSVSGWSVRGKWGGVRLGDLLALANPKPEATHVQFTSYREIYTTCVPLDVALKERTLLAYEFDGEALDADYGGPVRIFCPYLWGYKSAKSVVAVTLEDHSIPGFWEVRGYPDAAQITPRQVLDVNTQRQRRIPSTGSGRRPSGEVIEFLD
jgi:DMSO/TMAO reductase YedYZ molybdopterin-dependent catalytic subunit